MNTSDAVVRHLNHIATTFQIPLLKRANPSSNPLASSYSRTLWRAEQKCTACSHCLHHLTLILASCHSCRELPPQIDIIWVSIWLHMATILLWSLSVCRQGSLVLFKLNLTSGERQKRNETMKSHGWEKFNGKSSLLLGSCVCSGIVCVLYRACVCVYMRTC